MSEENSSHGKVLKRKYQYSEVTTLPIRLKEVINMERRLPRESTAFE